MACLRTAIALALLSGLLVSRAAAQELTGEVDLRRAYDAIFDARFEDVPQRLMRACPPGPAEACQLLDAIAVWWQIQLDPASVALDAPFQSRIDAAIEAAEAWTRREPQRAEAWFYVGAAYGARAQWRVLRREHLGAARDGKRIKEALERALALDSRLQEAYFGIGLYHYYADVAPASAKILRWLLLLPGGDRTEGLQQMMRAREHAELLRDEADYQLHLIYLWYEKQPQRALELLTSLVDRHPRNPLFPQLIAQVQDVYLHDLAASLRTWQSLLAAGRTHRVAYPELAEMRARLGIASVFERLDEHEAAIEQLRAVIAAKPLAPFGAYAQAQRDLTRLRARAVR
jgi:tetratricopeptide (TPR) repeat protein